MTSPTDWDQLRRAVRELGFERKAIDLRREIWVDSDEECGVYLPLYSDGSDFAWLVDRAFERLEGVYPDHVGRFVVFAWDDWETTHGWEDRAGTFRTLWSSVDHLKIATQSLGGDHAGGHVVNLAIEQILATYTPSDGLSCPLTEEIKKGTESRD